MGPTSRRTLTITAIAAAVVALLVVGSLIYWVADGKPGTPAEFRTAVADRGLTVEWANNGPRAGDGVVKTDCGDQAVTVNDVDGDLWVEWGDQRAPISAEVIDQINQCA